MTDAQLIDQIVASIAISLTDKDPVMRATARERIRVLFNAYVVAAVKAGILEFFKQAPTSEQTAP